MRNGGWIMKNINIKLQEMAGKFDCDARRLRRV